jgi:hypothetical protein
MPLESNTILHEAAAATTAAPSVHPEAAASSTADAPEAIFRPGSAMEFLADFPVYPFL